MTKAVRVGILVRRQSPKGLAGIDNTELLCAGQWSSRRREEAASWNTGMFRELDT